MGGISLSRFTRIWRRAVMLDVVKQPSQGYVHVPPQPTRSPRKTVDNQHRRRTVYGFKALSDGRAGLVGAQVVGPSRHRSRRVSRGISEAAVDAEDVDGARGRPPQRAPAIEPAKLCTDVNAAVGANPGAPRTFRTPSPIRVMSVSAIQMSWARALECAVTLPDSGPRHCGTHFFTEASRVNDYAVTQSSPFRTYTVVN